ncbi:hypothetical protein FTUN_3236 [Frigoriglobus tundricola]|uniref:Uncharacterized protein n=1 Tax=Frigoriglobus tundricola TaxID=2774151 RepID=A0A6M5YRT0_9BACT|nr:hypothetical protein FTUN_3236 [Frigoriglobus tundricola]
MLAAKLAAFAALVATPALAQPPPSAYQPPSNSPASYQPLNMQNYQPAGGQPAAGPQPAAGQQPGGLPLPRATGRGPRRRRRNPGPQRPPARWPAAGAAVR